MLPLDWDFDRLHKFTSLWTATSWRYPAIARLPADVRSTAIFCLFANYTENVENEDFNCVRMIRQVGEQDPE